MSLFGNSGKHSSHAHQAQRASGQDQEAPAKGAPASGRKGKSRRKTLRIVGIVSVALLLLCLLGVAAFEIWAKAPNVQNGGLVSQAGDKEGDSIVVVTPTPAPTPAATEASENTPAPSQAPESTPAASERPTSGRRPGTYTVLIVGKDVAGMNTDTIMVAMLDTEEGKLNVVSIPRDTMVNVVWAVKKVNSYYGQTGSEEGLVEGVSELVGYKVDNYVVVEMSAFEQVIDAIGGVYFDVPMRMEWGDPTINKHYSISAGYQWLDGHNALGVVRFRQNTDGTGYPTGDIGRVETQQKFAVALVKQMLKLGNIPNLTKVINIITNNLKTNLSSGNLAFFAQEFLKLESDDITFSVMPNVPVYIRGGSYVSIVLSDWMDMLNEKLNPYYESITEQNLDILVYQNDSFYSTTGILAGGFESFYDYTS